MTVLKTMFGIPSKPSALLVPILLQALINSLRCNWWDNLSLLSAPDTCILSAEGREFRAGRCRQWLLSLVMTTLYGLLHWYFSTSFSNLFQHCLLLRFIALFNLRRSYIFPLTEKTCFSCMLSGLVFWLYCFKPVAWLYRSTSRPVGGGYDFAFLAWSYHMLRLFAGSTSFSRWHSLLL